MKKLIVLLIVIAFCMTTLPAMAKGVGGNAPKPVTQYSPATETTINGIPESQIITPMITIGPILESYSPTQTEVKFFKKIVSSYVDNRGKSLSFPLSITVTQSSSQGSEWNVSLALTGEMKLWILSKAGATITGGLKETRATNEAVGITGTMTVPAGKQGQLDGYYGGVSSNGTLYYYYDTDGVITRYSKPCAVTSYKKGYVEVNWNPIVW